MSDDDGGVGRGDRGGDDDTMAEEARRVQLAIAMEAPEPKITVAAAVRVRKS